ncbi:hypothetical protein LAP9435_2787 [Lactiplantibacillus plantarum]|nr:hypothetical protein LAP8962_02783 [Lactiplantibacillus plantarum]VFI65255.1 hypothetical protein LAP9434_02790 [Lactiplantibacillus plantarum]VFQ57763.1 hypothetical protein LAP9435_2787 [Lactiplantibacillus plantarum]
MTIAIRESFPYRYDEVGSLLRPANCQTKCNGLSIRRTKKRGWELT